MQPEDCCRKCDPGLLESHAEAVEEYLHAHQKLIRKRQAHHLPGLNLKKLPSDLMKLVLQKLLIWQHQMWDQHPFPLNQPNNITPEIILAEMDLASLASHIHIAST